MGLHTFRFGELVRQISDDGKPNQAQHQFSMPSGSMYWSGPGTPETTGRPASNQRGAMVPVRPNVVAADITGQQKQPIVAARDAACPDRSGQAERQLHPKRYGRAAREKRQETRFRRSAGRPAGSARRPRSGNAPVRKMASAPKRSTQIKSCGEAIDCEGQEGRRKAPICHLIRRFVTK